MTDEVFTQTIEDLIEDLELQLWLAEDQISKLTRKQSELTHHPAAVPDPATLHYISDTLKRTMQEYQALADSITKLLSSRSTWDPHSISSLITQKTAHLFRLHAMQQMTTGICTADIWQSPSTKHATYSQAGTLTGTIKLHTSDYNRDGTYPAVEAYAKAYVRAFVDSPFGMTPSATVTASGMAAFATALTCIQSHMTNSDRILMSSQSYFQNTWHAKKVFGECLSFFDDTDIPSLIRSVEIQRPKAVILNSLNLSEQYTMPHLHELLPKLARSLPPKSWIVLDNTGLATSFQPLMILPRTTHVSLLVIESLLKFHQYGLDRTNAGIIWGYNMLSNPNTTPIVRDHGTVLGYTELMTLPSPNRRYLDRRLARINRNNTRVANDLYTHICHHETLVTDVRHPSIPTHASYTWSQHYSFLGGSFGVILRPKLQMSDDKHPVMVRLMALARSHDVNIQEGSSFGFDATRILPVPQYATETFRLQQPLRISVGTETRAEIDKLITLLCLSLT